MKLTLKQVKEMIAWLANHLFGVILSVVITSSITVSVILIFWKWLKTQHSLQLLGWLWVLIVIAISIAPASVVFLTMRRKAQRKKKLVTDDTGIKNILRQWFRKDVCKAEDPWAERTPPNYELLAIFSDLDYQLGLSPGSAKRLLKEVIKEFETWETKNEAQDSIVIFRKGISFTCGFNNM